MSRLGQWLGRPDLSWSDPVNVDRLAARYPMPGERDTVIAMNGFARDRMLFATAYPSCHPRDQIERVLALPLSSQALERYFHRNALELFGFDRKDTRAAG